MLWQEIEVPRTTQKQDVLQKRHIRLVSLHFLYIVTHHRLKGHLGDDRLGVHLRNHKLVWLVRMSLFFSPLSTLQLNRIVSVPCLLSFKRRVVSAGQPTTIASWSPCSPVRQRTILHMRSLVVITNCQSLSCPQRTQNRHHKPCCDHNLTDFIFKCSNLQIGVHNEHKIDTINHVPTTIQQIFTFLKFKLKNWYQL